MKQGNTITKLVLVVGGLLVLAFAWWTISPAFIDTEVQEELAIDVSGIDVSERERENIDEQPSEGTQEVEQIIVSEPQVEQESPSNGESSFSSQQVVVEGTSRNRGGISTFEFDDEDPRITTREQVPAIQEPTPSQQTDQTEPQSEPTPTPATQSSVRSGSFNPAQTRYNISGDVFVSGNDLSLADFDSRAVPDGRVYLSKDPNGNDFVDLGALKGNRGNQNYSIPSSVDANDYRYVVIWCRAFSVFMGSTQIN